MTRRERGLVGLILLIVIVAILLFVWPGWAVSRTTTTTPPPASAQQSTQQGTVGTQQPATKPIQPGPALAPVGPQSITGGQCEGLLDYGVFGLTEFSSAQYYLHVQIWRQGQDNFERESLLPPGRYAIKVNNLNGHTWELGPNCSAEQALAKHVEPSIQRRQSLLASTKGYVHWSQLVSEGLISVIAQVQPVPNVPNSLSGAGQQSGQVQQQPVQQQQPAQQPSGLTTQPVAPSAQQAPVVQAPVAPAQQAVACDSTREDRTPGQSWTPRGDFRIVNFWSNQTANQQERKLLLRPGENPGLLGGGSSWSWPANCESTVLSEFGKNPKQEVTLAQLRTEGLAR